MKKNLTVHKKRKMWYYLHEVSSLQGKKKRRYCILLVICLFASFICFDHFKAGEKMFFSGAADTFDHILTEGSSISSEDVCTVEMLGNIHSGLLTRPSSTQNSESQRKSETLSCLLGDLASLQVSLHFLTSADTGIDTAHASAAGIIHFIHDKDGKKKI